MKSISLFVLCFLALLPFILAQEFASVQVNAFGISPDGNRSSPALADIDDDGDLDLFTGLTSGDFAFFENIGAPDFPQFGVFTIAPFNISSIGGDANPFFVDLDDDGDLDLFAGGEGGLRFYENVGNASIASFGPEMQSPYSIISPPGISKPYLADIDDDDDMDLFVGSSDGNTYFYENTGSQSSPAFAAAMSNPFGLMDVGNRSAPSLADLDEDGDLDLLIGNQAGDLAYFENTGSASDPSFNSIGNNPFNLQNVNDDAKPCFGDLDDDGDLDLMVGNALGDYHYFENVTSTSISDPVDQIRASIFPNPVRTSLTIQIQGIESNDWDLIIIDTMGRTQVVKPLVQSDNIHINAELSRGICYAYLERNNEKKLIGTIVVH